jgi:hypothetical protein
MKRILFFGLVGLCACKNDNFNEENSSAAGGLVQSVSPVRAQYGNTITLTGKHFGSSTTSTRVLLNGLTITPTAVNDSVLTFVLPKAAGSGLVRVSNSGAVGAGQSFEYLYTGNVSLFSGNGDTGSTGNTALQVGWQEILGITSDPAGNIYAADRGASRLRKIDINGLVTNLPNSANPSNFPKDILYDVLNNEAQLWISSGNNNNSIRKFSFTTQAHTLIAGLGYAYHIDGLLSGSHYLNNPYGMAKKANGSLLIADVGNHVIRNLIPNDRITTPVGTPNQQGDVNGTGASARFNDLRGICAIGGDEFLVCDMGVHKIKKITSNYTVETFAGSTAGYIDGAIATAKFNNPVYPVKDDRNNILITCLDGTIRCISPSGFVYTAAGSNVAGNTTYVNGIGSAARFNGPTKIIFVGNATFLIADTGNKRIRKMVLE